MKLKKISLFSLTIFLLAGSLGLFLRKKPPAPESTPLPSVWIPGAEEQFVSESIVVESRTEPIGERGTFERVLVLAPPETTGLFYRVEEKISLADDGTETVLSRMVMDADQVMVKLKKGVDRAALEELVDDLGGRVRERKLGPVAYLVHLAGHGLDAVPDALAQLNQATTIVHCAETDFLAFPMGMTVPNDPVFSNQWGLHNTSIFPEADIHAPEAWIHGTGSRGIKACVLDSGIDFTHEDLAPNIWTNMGEAGSLSTNGLDDDGNGYIDDYRGWDFVLDNNDPSGEAHGIGIYGIIGAAGNNGVGMAGVCWDVSLIAVSVSGFAGGGQGSTTIDAMNYAVSNGCRAFNVSWGFKAGEGGYNQIFRDAIAAIGEQGALLVAAVGNQNRDNDADPMYPASYDLSNIIAVAASDWEDSLCTFSHYGATSVDLAAPGEKIYAPAYWFEAGSNSYTLKTGTSFAAPHVVGACAWLWSLEPDLTALEVKARIMNSVDVQPSLAGKCVSGGRLNMVAALYNGASDTDGDGLPDWWEEQYFDGDADPSATCSNGVDTVYSAYIAGLDPMNSTNRFRLSNVRNSLEWNDTYGRVYTIYWTSNLLDGFDGPLTNLPGGAFTDLLHDADSEGFYKIEVKLDEE